MTVRAMVLAAGYGSRLRPLTAAIPKPLVPVANRPLLWYILSSLRVAGIRTVAINLHYHGEQIRQWLGRGEALDIDVTYSEEAELLGSAGGVRRVRDFFGNDPALIVHGDLLFDVDLRDVIQYHLSRQAEVTLVLHPAHQRFKYGMIKVNPRGEIAQFVQQQAPWVSGPLTEAVFTGVQILDASVLDSIAAEQVSVLTTDVYPRLLTPSARVFGYLMQGYWSDIGTPLRYWEANLDVLSGRMVPVGSLPASQGAGGDYQGVPPETKGELSPSVAVGRGVSLGVHCDLGPQTVVGEECWLADGVRITQSVLWPRAHVGARATIERSIVMSDVVVPAGALLQGKIVSPSGITELS